MKTLFFSLLLIVLVLMSHQVVAQKPEHIQIINPTGASAPSVPLLNNSDLINAVSFTPDSSNVEGALRTGDWYCWDWWDWWDYCYCWYDCTPPEISCPANIVVNTDPGECSAEVTYCTPVGTDNCPGSYTYQYSGLP